MTRKAKLLIAITTILVLGVMMFAATTSRVLRSGVLAPLNGMIVRERSELVEDPDSHKLHVIRVMQINKVSRYDISSAINPNLTRLGFLPVSTYFQSHPVEMYVRRRSVSPGDSSDLATLESETDGIVYVSDLHGASTMEVILGRVLGLGKRTRSLEEVGAPKMFLDKVAPSDTH